MKKTLFTLFALAALIGCVKEQAYSPSPKGNNVFTVEPAPCENADDDSQTKSKFYDESSQKVTNLNVWVYVSSTGALANTGTIPGTSLSYKSYFENTKELDGDLLFPNLDETYDIYMFTNVGQITPPANKAAAAAYKYTFSSYDSFTSKGFPMAAHYNFCPSDPNVSHSLAVKRLVSKYTVTFKFDEDNNYTFNLKSATVKQSSKVITPFIGDSKASSETEVFQTADELDVSKLSTPAGQDLYMLENVQGNVFSSGIERSEKNIASPAKPATSFLEFVGELDKNDGTGYKKVTCRYYFGSGTYAGVKRNYNVPLTLTMKNSILEHDDWVVEPEEPYNTGYIVFDPTSLSIVGDENWNGFIAQPYSAESINDNIKYTLSYNASDFTAAGLTLQYRKNESSSWADYSGQELTGKYYFQVKSTYSGSEQKTVSLNASCKSTNTSMSLNISGTSGASKTITINFNPQIKNYLTDKLGAASSQWWVRTSQEIFCWDSNGKIAEGCFVDFHSWNGWEFTEVTTNHNTGETKQGHRVMTITATTTSTELYIGLKKTYNSVYVDDDNYEPIWPKGTLEPVDSENVPVSLSEKLSVGTEIANPYGIKSNEWQQIYKVSVTSNKTITVTKGN